MAIITGVGGTTLNTARMKPDAWVKPWLTASNRGPSQQRGFPPLDD